MNNENKKSTFGPTACAAVMVVILTVMSPAQLIAQDTVYQLREGKNPGRVRGKITNISPLEVTVTTDNGQTKIAGDQVVRVIIEGQPPQLTRARERFLEARYSDCVEELEKMNADPAGQKWQPEADYLRAAVNAEISLSGGSVTAQEAGQQINQFLTTHSESYLKFPAMEQLGKLLFAFGRLDNASKSFDQLAKSGWPKYQRIGTYWRGICEREKGDLDGAINVFKQMSSIQAGDPELETWQLMAACQIARCQGESGDAKAAIASLRKIIKEENPDNFNLFATAFNSLGSIYLKQNLLKEARTEFLKTELLYPTATNEHAEALHHLTKIWAQLNENDRATQAKERLKNRHPNSWWATKK